MRLPLALALLALVLLAGCGGSDGGSTGAEPSATEETTASTAGGETGGDVSSSGGGLETIEVESAGFSLGIPSSWQGLSGDDFAESDELQRFQQENPSLAPYLEALKSGDSPMKLIAADPNLTKDFATNVNVVVQQVPEGTSAEEYAALNKSGITSQLDVQGEIQTESVDHAAGDASVARYEANLTTGGQEKTFSFVQYYFVEGTNAFVVTYTTVPEALGKYEADFEASADSFRFL